MAAQSPNGTISYAIGSFDSVSSGIREAGQIDNQGPQIPNAYSLQLNTNLFDTPLCAAAGAPQDPSQRCMGWEQFVQENDNEQPGVFIQYWLVNYNNKTCPQGWRYYETKSGNDCAHQPSFTTVVPSQDIGSLSSTSMTAAADAASDSVIFTVGGDAYLFAGDNALSVAGSWRLAEFNVYGDAGGGQANFSSGSTLVVRTSINNGTSSSDPPLCEAVALTAETNNLTISGMTPSSASEAPSIAFTETSNSGPRQGCVTNPGSHVTRQLISGREYMEFGKDTSGLNFYTSNGALCVVHRPSCGHAWIFTGGANGKDHYLSNKHPLPSGVTVDGVQYTMFWPPGLTKTDRGGLGSSGSYGADESGSIVSSPPYVDVHWQNTCTSSGGSTWAGLPVTYQISFLVSVPPGVNVQGATPLSQLTGQTICHAEDMPVTNGGQTGPVISTFVAPLALFQAPLSGGYLPWQTGFPQGGLVASTPVASWTILNITNVNPFEVFVVGVGHSTDECFKKGAGQDLKAGASLKDVASVFNTTHPPIALVVCTTGPEPQGVSLSIKYQH